MVKNKYEYSTSPRKLEPDYRREREQKTKKIKIVEDLPRQKVKLSNEQKKRQMKMSLVVAALFMLLLTISYRNSQINEKFSEVQNLKRQVASIEKENEQLKVNIENAVNLNNIEKQAKEKLGMQKLTNKQTQYISLPKKDYIEPAREEVVVEKEQGWFGKLMKKLNLFN